MISVSLGALAGVPVGVGVSVEAGVSVERLHVGKNCSPVLDPSGLRFGNWNVYSDSIGHVCPVITERVAVG